ncbi:MAG: DNA-binding protein [Candidatus Methanomethylicus sp.]|nr:DNA-binding protein [Candidatus Methanomethylicus sp.]
MAGDPDEIELMKQKKLAAMRRQMAEEQSAERMQHEAEAQKENLLRSILSPEARSRLNNLKMVRPDFAEQLELQLIQLAQDRRLPLPLSDEQLKQILVELGNRKRDIKITRL